MEIKLISEEYILTEDYAYVKEEQYILYRYNSSRLGGK